MSRVETLVGLLPDERTAALITSPLSLRYLCGFSIENGIIIAAKEESVLFVPERTFSALNGRVNGFKPVKLVNGQQLLDMLIKYGIKSIMIEADKMTVSEWKVFKEQLHYAEIVDSEELSEWITGMRSVKSPEEIASITKAQSFCDKAFERLIGSVRKGMTERQIATLIDLYLAEAGSEGSPFRTLVLSGENSFKNRSKPSDKKIGDGEFVIMEFGATVDGYCAKMCRTVGVGSVDDRMDEAYRAVFCAISDGVKALRSGIGGKVADSVVRSTLNSWGFDKYCTGGFAHGIGLEDREPPYIGRSRSAILKENTVLAVSCDIRLPGKYGIRIGDMTVIEENGCSVLTKGTRSLVFI